MIKALKFMWKNMGGVRFKYISGLVLSVFAASLVIIIPYLSKILIDDCIKGGNREYFFPLIFTMCGVALLQAAIKVVRMIFLEHASQRMLINIRKTVFDKIQNQDMTFFDDIPSGDIITRVTGDLEFLRHFTAWAEYHMIEMIVMFTASITMLFFINHTLTLCLLAVMPFLLIVSFIYGTKIRPLFFSIRSRLSTLNGAAEENINGNRVVKAFVREDFEIKKFAKKSLDFKDYNLKATYMWQKVVPVMNFFTESLSIITLVVGGILVIKESITMGDLTLFTSLTWSLAMPMRTISIVLNATHRLSTSAEKVIEICEYPCKIKDADDAVDSDEKLKGKIEFKNVTFGYKETMLLDNVSFVINPGETVVVMGPTGSGKTTLINLILRFYDVNSGSILLDGIDIRKRTLKSVRDAVSVATQEVFLFSDTIDSNIAFSDVNLSEAEVVEYAKLACADEFVVHTTDGYGTIIGERGVGLSGGQRQRIALARALAAKPSVLILDDTTSAVDTDTESKIRKGLSQLPYDATKIIVAQRISATKNADKIFIIKDGKIQIGTHNELIESNYYYRSICELQGVAPREV